jgi:hypothetical protein
LALFTCPFNAVRPCPLFIGHSARLFARPWSWHSSSAPPIPAQSLCRVVPGALEAGDLGSPGCSHRTSLRGTSPLPPPSFSSLPFAKRVSKLAEKLAASLARLVDHGSCREEAKAGRARPLGRWRRARCAWTLVHEPPVLARARVSLSLTRKYGSSTIWYGFLSVSWKRNAVPF